MIIRVTDELMFRNCVHPNNVIGCILGDRIARANDEIWVEKLIPLYAGMTLVVDDETFHIEEAIYDQRLMLNWKIMEDIEEYAPYCKWGWNEGNPEIMFGKEAYL